MTQFFRVIENSLDFNIILCLDNIKGIEAIFDFSNWQLSAPRFIHPLTFLTPAKMCEGRIEILANAILDAE